MVGFEVIFLLVLAFIWILVAAIQDLKYREVANWLNFSLIIFALAFRFFYSLFNSGGFGFFIQGVVGLGVFVIIAHIFYYSRLFAGGDAKLLMALGAILPFSGEFYSNLSIMLVFLVLLLVTGSVYGFIYGTALAVLHGKKFSKEARKQLYKFRKFFFVSCAFAVLWAFIMIILGVNEFLILSLIFILIPLFFIYGKSIENSCLVKPVKTSELKEGDWLYEDFQVKGKRIKSSWEGLSIKDINYLKKHTRGKKILIKYGIPFVPAFLFAFILFIVLLLMFPQFFLFFGFN